MGIGGRLKKGGKLQWGGGTHPALERSKKPRGGDFFAIGHGPLFRAKMDTARRKKVEGNKMKFFTEEK